VTRRVYAQHTVTGDVSQLDEALRSNIRQLLRKATDSPPSTPDVDGSLPIQLSGRLFGTEVSKTVRLRTVVATVTEGRLRIPVSWYADPGHAIFPVFDGAVELEPLASDSAQLILVGSYTAPLGVVGEAIDAAMMHTVVQRTADWLIDRLAPRGPRRGQRRAECSA
jgi:hypothetical protein